MKIVMVYIDPKTSLFLYGINNDEVIFRSSRNPAHLQTERLEIKDGMCYVGLYYFSEDYLKKVDPILPPALQE